MSITTYVWLGVALLAVGLFIWLMSIQKKAAIAVQAETEAATSKSEIAATVDMAQKAVDRPDKATLVDTLKKGTFLIPLLIVLTSCGNQVKYVCPPMPSYTAAQQSQAASEISSLPDTSVILLMIEDYKASRNACKK